MSMYCQNCGAEIDTRYPFPDGSVQCPQCGMIYRPANYQPVQQQYQQPQFQPTNSQNVQPEHQPRRRRADMYGDQQDASQEPVQSQYQQPTGQQFRQPPTPTYQQPVQQESASVQIVKKSPLKKIIIPAAAILVVVILSVVLLGNRSPYAKQYALIAKFEKAYNNQDYYAMIDCFEPQVKQLLGGLMSLNGSMNGTNYSSSMMDILPYASKALGASGVMEGSFGKVKFTPYSCKVNGTDAVVAYHVEHTLNGNTQKYDEAAQLVQVNGEWYFSSVQADQNALLSQVEEEKPPVHPEQSEDMFDQPDTQTLLSESVSFDDAKALGGFFYPTDEGEYLILDNQNSYNMFHRLKGNLIFTEDYDFPELARSKKILYFNGKTNYVGLLTIAPILYDGYVPGLYFDREYYYYWDLEKEYLEHGTMTASRSDYYNSVPDYTYSSSVTINDKEYDRDDFVGGLLQLEKGKTIHLEWFEGTNYKETTFESKYHRLYFEQTYDMNSNLTKNGYAEIDISNVMPGLYAVCSEYGGKTTVMGVYRITDVGENNNYTPIIIDEADCLTQEEETQLMQTMAKLSRYCTPAFICRERPNNYANEFEEFNIPQDGLYVAIYLDRSAVEVYYPPMISILFSDETKKEISNTLADMRKNDKNLECAEYLFNTVYEALQK